MSDLATSGGEGGTGTAAPSGDVGGAPSTSGDAGQGGAMPSGGQLPQGAGDFNPENLQKYSQQIFGAGHEDDPVKPDAEQPAAETPAQPAAVDAPDWAALGEYDQVRDRLGLATALLSDDPAQFWETLHGKDVDRVIGVLDAAIERFGPEFFIDALHTRGALSIPSSAELAAIDEKYHDLYRTLSPQERYEIQAEEDPDLQFDMLESRYKDYERDRALDRHEEQFKAQEAERRAEQSNKITTDLTASINASISQQFRSDLIQLTGSPELGAEAAGVLVAWAAQMVNNDPASQGAINRLNEAIARGDAREAQRLALPVQAKVGRLIQGFLGKFTGGAAPAQAQAPVPRASAAAQGAARVDRVLDRALDKAPAASDDLTEESKRDARIRAISRSIFG